jgi:pyrrolidone-carboxylate peptidase
LEQYGYNLCHFRCPDEQNNQPMRTTINDTKKLDESLYTHLPLKMIQETLSNEGYNVEGNIY